MCIEWELSLNPDDLINNQQPTMPSTDWLGGRHPRRQSHREDLCRVRRWRAVTVVSGLPSPPSRKPRWRNWEPFVWRTCLSARDGLRLADRHLNHFTFDPTPTPCRRKSEKFKLWRFGDARSHWALMLMNSHWCSFLTKWLVRWDPSPPLQIVPVWCDDCWRSLMVSISVEQLNEDWSNQRQESINRVPWKKDEGKVNGQACKRASVKKTVEWCVLE